MKRREFIAGLGSAAAWPVLVRAQHSARVARIGYLGTGSPSSPETMVNVEAFLRALRQLSYVDGQNIVIDYRWAHGYIERFAGLAAELVRNDVELIVAANTPAALGAKQATATIPIVVQVMGDPVKDGLVTSLARPGGNVTGSTFLGPELTAKRLQLLKDILPEATNIAVLWQPGAYGEGTMNEMIDTTARAAEALNLRLHRVEVHSPDELNSAFSKTHMDGVEAVLIFPSPMLYSERRRIVDLALKNQLPLMTMDRGFVDLGGLISYGASLRELFSRSAIFVDKILKGARPGDLPVEQPATFELVINLKTGKSLAIKIPPSLLARADEVIE